VEKKILRLLIVDDSPDDAELAVATLRKAGYMLKNQRVQDLASMQAALDKGAWDVVLSEYTLTHFGASMAIDLVKQAHLDIPFIVFSHNIRDPDIIKIMRNGAHDVVMKNQVARLAPAVERELRVTEERRQFQKMSQALQEVENKNRAIIEGSREAIGYCQEGMHIDANKTYLDLFGYENLSEIEGVPVLNLIDKSDHARFKEYLRKPASSNTEGHQEFLAMKKDGVRLHVELATSPVVLNGENCVQFVVTDISKRKAAENRLQYLNLHDPLTGLFNRHHFTEELTKILDKIRQDGSQSALLYFDFKELKEINDALSHAAGDRQLLKIARLLRDKLGESTMLARFSGDEFTALLHDKNEDQVKQLTADLMASMKDTTFHEEGKTFHCDGTISVVILDKETVSAQMALNKAYQACLQSRPPKAASESAPAPVQEPVVSAPVPVAPATAASAASVTTPSAPPITATASPTPASTPQEPAFVTRGPTADQMASARKWGPRLKQALDKNGFQLAYQPIVNLHGEAAEYFEVLLRLNGPQGELIHAGEFMHAAEHLGLLTAIDQWVIRQSILSLAALHGEGRKTSFFVNLSSDSLRDPDLLALLQKQLTSSHIKPEYLVLEADESAVMANPGDAAMFMQATHKIGCKFSVDNFGDHLATLNSLRNMPIDFLKFSGALIRNLSSDVLARASLKAIIELAKAMDKQTIAKFVEQADDLGILWNLGFDYVQGNYFQQADARLDYAFTDEATLSSETATSPNWASNSRR
jgi:diguanylate cyclase (GGDEF)-like protein/PAS domain S-box-containing protein